MRIFLAISLLALFALTIFRFAPSDPARWHIDPRNGRPGDGRFVIRADGGDIAGPKFAESPESLLERVDAIALSEPRTKRLAGSVEEGRVTYITRTRGFGFPDYTTVETVADGDGARLIAYARLRFGRQDLGVNRARLLRWLEALEA